MTTAWVVALLPVLGDIAVRAVRLRLLTRTGAVLTPWEATRVNAYGDAASAITPARLGGEPARFVALTKAGVPSGVGIVALAAERVIDVGLAAVVTIGITLVLAGRRFSDVQSYLSRLLSPDVLPWIGAVGLLLIVAAAVAVKLRHRFPQAVVQSVREAVVHARSLSAGVLAGAVTLTAVSMAARVAILPVLLRGFGPIGDPVAAAIGSFALIYAQLLLPTPAGAGGVELGFVVGVAPFLSASQVAALLITWRVFTLAIPAGLGVLLFALSRRQ